MTNEQESSRLTFSQMLGAYGTRADRERNRRLTRWSIAWAITIIVAASIITAFELASAVQIAVAMIPLAPAVMTVKAFLEYVRKSDELMQRVQLEGLSIAFGVSWMFFVSYVVALAAGAPQPPVTAIVLLMTGSWLVGNTIAVRRNL